MDLLLHFTSLAFFTYKKLAHFYIWGIKYKAGLPKYLLVHAVRELILVQLFRKYIFCVGNLIKSVRATGLYKGVNIFLFPQLELHIF